MSGTVTLPIWLFVLLLLFAAVTALSHLLFPSVRWFFRKRAERVVNRLNKSLTRPIQPFKLARRHDMIQRILFDPGVVEAANAYARERGVPSNVAFETAERYAREIVPAFSASLYFGFGARAAKLLARAFYKVELLNRKAAKLDTIDPDATVIFVINHRSNMDYVLVTYLVAPDSALSYAVGEWARVWPLRPIIKMMGGYFIRRRELNPLYRKVMARYVQLASSEGVTQAIFLEGGLSRTGGLGEPKLGLLSYIVEGFENDQSNDIVFVPVGINYDRVIEDRTLVAAAEDPKRQFRFRWMLVFRYARRHLVLRLTRRFKHLGIAAVSFGTPTSLRSFLKKTGPDSVEKLASLLMDEIAETVPVTPVPLLASILEENSKGLSKPDLLANFETEMNKFKKGNAKDRVAFSGTTAEGFDWAFSNLQLRGLIVEDEGVWRSAKTTRNLVEYYAKSAPKQRRHKITK